ncbi:MAG: cupin domain-containing protein [Candidatus Zixiibacteriota bacterium]|nr:MAG: cupin domain-containing protein [candidate division Zixibacteria bacterium]
MKWDGTVYPDMLRNLPEVDMPVEGVRGWLLQGENRQIVFFDIDTTAAVPAHKHCAQWGIMVAGEMSLTIGGETKVYRKGDSYYIPEGVEHSARFHSRVNVIDVFDAADRYKTK